LITHLHNFADVTMYWCTLQNVDVDADICNICIYISITQLALLGIHILAVIAVIKCDYYPLSAYELMSILGIEVVIPTSSKHKKDIIYS
jgi:hypothetical protein